MISTVELRQVTDFLSKYQISQINPETTLLSSKNTNLLVKVHQIDGDYEEIVEILDKHLSFDHEYVCPLLQFEPCDDQENDQTIRAIYQLDRMTLKDSIDNRRDKGEYFAEPELWILLSSLVNSLIYLQSKDVVYGVLSTSKIFIEDKIRLMDPSAFNINPMNVSRLSLHSPEIKKNEQGIDFYQSDVYLLGLCLLSAASLMEITNSVCEEQICQLLKEVEGRYSSDLLHVLKHMLTVDCQERPTFQNILQYIQTEIQIKQAKNCSASPLLADEEDGSADEAMIEEIDDQNVDILQHQDENIQCMNQYEQAMHRYIYSTSKKHQNQPTNCQSSLQSISHLGSIEFIGHKDTVNLKENSLVQEFKLEQSSLAQQTVAKHKKNKAHQIKNRNSEAVRAVKTVNSIIVSNDSAFTSPQLMSIIRQETKRVQTSRIAKRGS